MIWPITFEDVLAARERLTPLLAPTPLRSYAALDEAVGLHVLVKHENHQPTNSFKVRNGLSAMSALTPEQQGRGVVAATRGNHGLGLAWAGKEFGVPVTICVPTGNNPEKNEAMRGLGVELVEAGRDYDEAVAVMNRLVDERGLYPIHSTNNANVIAGAATMTLEMLEQADVGGEPIEALVLAIGGGSQAVGALTVVRHLRPDIEVYGVQTEGASATYEGWKAGHIIVKPTADTFADGLATRTAYEMTFDALREGLEDFILVSEAGIADALRLLLRITHNLAEGAGAVGLAGVRKLAERLHGKTVATVLSGSNIDQETLRRVVCGEL